MLGWKWELNTKETRPTRRHCRARNHRPWFLFHPKTLNVANPTNPTKHIDYLGAYLDFLPELERANGRKNQLYKNIPAYSPREAVSRPGSLDQVPVMIYDMSGWTNLG